MQGPIDGEPPELPLFLTIMHKQLNSGQILNLGVGEIYQEVEIIPYVMILLLMRFEPILLPIKEFHIHPTDIALGLFIRIPLLCVLSNLRKLIHNDSPQHLLHNDLNNEEVEEVEEDIEEGVVEEVLEDGVGVVVVTDDARVGL